MKSSRPSSKLGPLPARLQHSPVELVKATIPDLRGRPSQPYRGLDTVALLLHRGTITIDMANAADKFREAFRVAHLDTLRAADMSRVPGAGGRAYDAPVWARKRVAETLAALGGVTRAPGSILWNVIGLELSLRRWSLEVAGLNQHCATGVLITKWIAFDGEEFA